MVGVREERAEVRRGRIKMFRRDRVDRRRGIILRLEEGGGGNLLRRSKLGRVAS